MLYSTCIERLSKKAKRANTPKISSYTKGYHPTNKYVKGYHPTTILGHEKNYQFYKILNTSLVSVHTFSFPSSSTEKQLAALCSRTYTREMRQTVHPLPPSYTLPLPVYTGSTQPQTVSLSTTVVSPPPSGAL